MSKLLMVNDILEGEPGPDQIGDMVGVRIRDARVQRGLSQESVAQMLGISTSHLCNVETGRKKPSFEMILAVAVLLNISLDYLLLGRGLMEKTIDSKVIFRSDDELDYPPKAEK